MEEKVIKRSPKKIIWNALFGLASVFFFLLPLSYLHLYSQKGTRLHTISLLLMLLVLFCAGVVVYQTYRLLSSDKEYLRCTLECLVWPSFGAFLLVTSLLSPFVFGKGDGTSYDKSFVNAACTFLRWSSCLSDIQVVKLR